MLCPTCQGSMRRFGFNRNGGQRYRCDVCKKTFTDEATRPADARCLDTEKAIQALRLLLEGNSVRATGRLLSMDKKTVLALVVDIGTRCDKFLRTAVAGVPCESVQCDEVWSFVFCKEKCRQRKGYGEDTGDCYTWTALEKTTKLLLAYAVGKRDNATATTFVRRLRNATFGHFQINTDGLSLYRSVIPLSFGYNQDHAQVVKVFGKAVEGEGRYSPAQLIDLHVEVGSGSPDLDGASTSFVERSNKTLRMQIRRFTRLTDGHSKLWRNHEAAIALFFTYYNFCRVHMSLKCTPAMKAGLTDHVWSMREVLEKVATY
jgi:transposase-like protein/IS1 family transposase